MKRAKLGGFDGISKFIAAQNPDVVVLEVMADYLDRTWWRALRQRLEAELHQEAIIIRAHSVEPL